MISHFSQEPFEGTLHIEDADLQKMAKVLNDVNIKECPYFDLSDKYGNSARYYKENQWIPVSERLPDVGRILISDGNQVLIGWYHGNNTWSIDGCEYDPILENIAWMPLPEPWKEEEQ